MSKLEQLEGEAENLKKQSILDQRAQALEIDIVFHENVVTKFIEQFTDAIQNATPDIKKTILKKCISNILIDRENECFQFDIRKIPAVTPELEKRFANRKSLTISLANIVSAASSGGTRCLGT